MKQVFNYLISIIILFISGIIGILTMLTILTIFCFPMAIVGGFLWTYVINTWLIYFGYIPCIVFWHGFLLGMIPYIGYYSVPIAIITFIVMLILV